MSCSFEVVYWSPEGAEPCDYCLDAEGYYATDGDVPDAHDLCQCTLIEVEADESQITFENFTECVYEVAEYAEEVSVPCTKEDFEIQLEGSGERGEEFDNDCFHDHCESTSAEWDPDSDLEDVETVPAGHRFDGDLVGYWHVVEYVADAVFTDGDETVVLDEVSGQISELVRVAIEGEAEPCTEGEEDGDLVG